MMLDLGAVGLASQMVLQGGPSSYLRPAAGSLSIPHRELNDSFCPAHTTHFTGSVDLSHGKELFYWLFESKSDPENDPLLVWLTGGPGGASTYAAITEVGPCFINVTDNSTYHNPYYWAQNANLLILDQPAGVGFSKASPDAKHQVKTLEAATEDFVEFMRLFVTEKFPRLSKNVLHIAGESYGGRWVPAFMERLLGLADAGSPRAVPNPIGSIILVNAVIGTLGAELSTANYEFGCTPNGAATKLGLGFNSTTCSRLQEIGPECESYGFLCESTGSIAVCNGAMEFCETQIANIIDLGSRNPYNVAKPCAGRNNLCLDTFPPAVNFFNRPEIQKAMGIEKRAWTPIDMQLLVDFAQSGALSQSVVPAIQNILNSDVRVLVMNGDLDALVITPGQARILDRLQWKGQLDYRQQQWNKWTAKDAFGVSSGMTKSSKNLKFVTFENAGHMVPGDDPRGASFILEDWLRG